MSTKQSIKWKEGKDGEPGYHLYEDLADWFASEDEDAENTPIYLELECVQAEMTANEWGVRVTVQMPRETARELGLLPHNGEVKADAL